MLRSVPNLIRSSVFLQNSLVLFLGTMGANVLNYVFHFAMGRMVTPAVYGEVESIVSLLTIVTVPGTAIALIATRYAASAKALGDMHRSARMFRKMSARVFRYGAVAFGIAMFATPAVASFLRIEETLAVVFLWGMMLLSFFSSVASGTLSGWQKFGGVSIVNIASATTKLLFAVVFVWLGFGVSGIVGAFLLASIVGYGIAVGYLIRIYKNNSKEKEEVVHEESGEEPMRITSYVLPVFFVSLAVAILGNIDMVLAKYHLDPDSAGAYGALFIVSKTIFFVGGILVSVMFAMSSEEHERSLRENIPGTRTARKAFFLTAIFCFGVVGFFALFPSFVMSVFFGSMYSSVSGYLWIFAMASAIATLAHFFSQYLLAIRQTTIAYWFLAIALIEIPIIFVFGDSLASIAGLSVLFQGLALIVGARVFWKNRKNTVQLKV